MDENIDFGEASNTVNKEANCEKNVDSFNVLYPVGKEINNEYANDERQVGGLGVEILHDNSWASGRDNSWHNGRDNSGENLEKRNNESDRGYGRKSDRRGHFGSRYINACYRGEAWQINKNQRN